MTYSKTQWTDNATPLSAANLNNLETQYDDAIADVEGQNGNVLTSVGVKGLPGATSGMRLVGATASGAPTSGTFAIGDISVDLSGLLWLCTAAGTPGTWMSLDYLQKGAGAGTQTVANDVVVDSHSLTVEAGQTGAASDSPKITMRGWNGTGPQNVYFAAASGGGWYVANSANNKVIFTMSDTGDINMQNGNLSGVDTITASNIGNVQIFTSSGTFAVPSGVSRVFVQMWGGGGAGESGGSATGPGGGGGSYAEGWVEVSSGQSFAVTVGTGGISNYSGGGTNGGDSSFGSYVKAGGGISGGGPGQPILGTFTEAGGSPGGAGGGAGATLAGGAAQNTVGAYGNIPGGGGAGFSGAGETQGARGEVRVYW